MELKSARFVFPPFMSDLHLRGQGWITTNKQIANTSIHVERHTLSQVGPTILPQSEEDVSTGRTRNNQTTTTMCSSMSPLTNGLTAGWHRLWETFNKLNRNIANMYTGSWTVMKHGSRRSGTKRQSHNEQITKNRFWRMCFARYITIQKTHPATLRFPLFNVNQWEMNPCI